MSLVARHAALTDIGLHRSTNEDAFVAEPPTFAVADGMGGAQAGEVASRLALDTLLDALAADDDLPAAAGAANEAVYGQSRADRSRSGMGTTLTAGVLGDDRLRFAHVGDSRLYLWRDERLTQVTDDHSLVGEMVREGHLSREAAATHPQRSILSRALGTEPRVEIDAGELELRAGDALLFCSDGLYSMVPDDTIAAVLAAVDDPERVARRLVSEAKNGGGHDNITVVVLRFDEAAGDQAGEPGEARRRPRPPRRSCRPSATKRPRPSCRPSATSAHGRAAGRRRRGGHDRAAGRRRGTGAAAPPSPTPSDAAAGDAAATKRSGGRRRARRLRAPRRRRRGEWLAVAVVVVVLALFVAAGATAGSIYYVGDYDGMVSVYHGLPFKVAGVKLHGLYLETTTPVAGLAPALRATIERHDLHRKAAALDLARRSQFPP